MLWGLSIVVWPKQKPISANPGENYMATMSWLYCVICSCVETNTCCQQLHGKICKSIWICSCIFHIKLLTVCFTASRTMPPKVGPLKSKQWSCSELQEGNHALMAAKKEAESNPLDAKRILEEQMKARSYINWSYTLQTIGHPFPIRPDHIPSCLQALQHQLDAMQVEPWMQLFRIAICLLTIIFLGLMFLFFKFHSWTLATAV